MTSKKKWLPPWGSRKSRAPKAPESTVFSAHIAGEVSETPEPSVTPAAEALTPAAEGSTPTAEIMTTAGEGTTPAAEALTPAAEGTTSAAEGMNPGVEGMDVAEEPANVVAAEDTTSAADGASGETRPRSAWGSSKTRNKKWLPSWASPRSGARTAPAAGAFSTHLASEAAATSGPGMTAAAAAGASAVEDGATPGESTASVVDPQETSPRRLFKGRRRSVRRPAVGGGLMRPFNLLPKKEVVEKEPTVGLGRLAAIGAIVVGIVGLGVWYAAENQSLGSAESDRDALVKLLEEPAPAVGGTSAGQAQRALFADQLLRTNAIAGVLNERVAWDRVLTSVAKVFPEGVWFTGMTASAPAPAEPSNADDAPAVDPLSAVPRLEISGFARDHENLAILMGRLTALRELEDVQLQSSGSTLIGTTEAVQFSVSAAVTPGRTS